MCFCADFFYKHLDALGKKIIFGILLSFIWLYLDFILWHILNTYKVHV